MRRTICSSTSESFSARQLCILVLCAGLMGLAFVVTPAQSGRGGARPVAPPPPETITTQSKSKTKLTKYSFLVANYVEGNVIPPSRAQKIFESFAQRLTEFSVITVTSVANPALNRREAMERAKTETENYVIWLRLQPDTPDRDTTYVGAVDFDDVVINYVVFAPGSGQVKTEGRVYYKHLYESSVSVSNTRSATVRQPQTVTRQPVEYTLERAGREAANRVVMALKIAQPRTY